jgi:triosephosphate isomerase
VDPEVEVVIAPPALWTDRVRSNLRSDFAVATQDVGAFGFGAHTGDLAAPMMADIGVSYSIVGHSERRALGESDEVVANKAASALQSGLGVIACLGESLADREAGRTKDVIVRQLSAYASQIRNWSKVVLAYEPVWAIGTGRTATPEQVAEAHKTIRYVKGGGGGCFCFPFLPDYMATTSRLHGSCPTGSGRCDVGWSHTAQLSFPHRRFWSAHLASPFFRERHEDVAIRNPPPSSV